MPPKPHPTPSPLKHGFYSRAFRKIEYEDLDVINANLEGEIALLRVYNRRLAEMAAGLDQTDEANIDRFIKVLSALGMTASRISNLTKAQSQLGGHTDETLAIIFEALAIVNKEQHLI